MNIDYLDTMPCSAQKDSGWPLQRKCNDSAMQNAPGWHCMLQAMHRVGERTGLKAPHHFQVDDGIHLTDPVLPRCG